jgi:hypothetical protein
MEARLCHRRFAVLSSCYGRGRDGRRHPRGLPNCSVSKRSFMDPFTPVQYECHTTTAFITQRVASRRLHYCRLIVRQSRRHQCELTAARSVRARRQGRRTAASTAYSDQQAKHKIYCWVKLTRPATKSLQLRDVEKTEEGGGGGDRGHVKRTKRGGQGTR